jgi:hypothetical protein
MKQTKPAMPRLARSAPLSVLERQMRALRCRSFRVGQRIGTLLPLKPDSIGMRSSNELPTTEDA